MLLDKIESGILALETESGPVYVQPSGWERLYLLWTFRNFNSLPLKTLNSRQRRLVGRLPRCRPEGQLGGPDRLEVIGTVEGAAVPSFVDRAPVETRVESRPESRPEERIFIPADHPESLPKDFYEKDETPEENAGTPGPVQSKPGLGRSKFSWVLAAGALSAFLAVTTLHRSKFTEPSKSSNVQIPVRFQTSEIVEAPVSSSASQALIETSLNAHGQRKDVQPNDDQPRPDLIGHSVYVAKPAPPIAEVRIGKGPLENLAEMISPSGRKEIGIGKIRRTPADGTSNISVVSIREDKAQEETPRIQFSGPPRKLIYPDYPNANVRGKVTLKAVIGGDGRVLDVKSLSGNKILSAAAARAIRQWRYDPFYKDGQLAETETNVSVLFVAADVITVSFPPAPL